MTTGAQNGTNIFLAVESTPGSGTYTMVGGQTSHTMTLNNTIIDITNKTSQQFRELLAEEGNQSIDISLELTFCSETAFDAVKAQARAKTQLSYQIAYDTEVLTVTLQVASWAETSPDSDKLTASVSFQSSGSFAWGAPT